jgi:hypothetical protein
MANEFIVKNGLISKSVVEVEGSLVTKNEIHNNGTSSLTGSGTITVSGASIVVLRITGIDAVTLPNGNNGQKLTIYIQQNTGTDTTITPTTLLGATSITMNAAGDSVHLLYQTSVGWVIIGGNGFTTS